MGPDALTIEAVRAAAARIAPHVVLTPCLHSRTLSAVCGAEIWVKFENLQFTGSFKDRGAASRLLLLTDDERERGVVAMSAGNHAQGVASLAGSLGIPAKIVMPESTPFTKVAQTKVLGADVVLSGPTVAECREAAVTIAGDEGRVLIHPYDDPAVIAGQGTVGLELADQVPGLDAVVVPVGGGGLLSGVATALAAIAPATAVVGAQTEAFPTLVGEPPDLAPSIPGGAAGTIADGIAVKQPGTLTTAIIKRLVERVVAVPDSAIESAIDHYLTIEKTVAEGAGAVSLAAVMTRPDLFAGRRVAVVLSGGNIDSRLLAAVLTRSMVRSGRLQQLRIEIDDRPGQLADLLATVGQVGCNIVEVQHQRLPLDHNARRVDVDLVVESLDAAHGERLVAQLRDAGFTVEVLPTR